MLPGERFEDAGFHLGLDHADDLATVRLPAVGEAVDPGPDGLSEFREPDCVVPDRRHHGPATLARRVV